MMFYSDIHSVVYRVLTKLHSIRKKRSWGLVPHQSDMTYTEENNQLLDPPLAGASTIAPDCCSAATVRGVLQVIDSLSEERFLSYVKNYYRKGLEKFGDKWVYADINTVLYGICKNIRIQSYLEIGVRRGRSMAIVASLRPECRIAGFDLWLPNYWDQESPGKEFVQKELKKVGYRGELVFMDGNSRKTVPEYFKKNPEAYFDLITVDGDHSVGGARVDIRNVIPRLKIGGVLVFDDITNPWHPYLSRVWDKMVVCNPRFAAYSFKELGLGVGFAVRRY